MVYLGACHIFRVLDVALTVPCMQRESSDPNGFLSLTLRSVSYLRSLLYIPGGQSKRWDVVLLGGLMGSAFSYVALPRCSVN